MKAFMCFMLTMVMLAGCASAPPPRFYVLTARNETGAVPGAPVDFDIVIGQASIPDAVDRPQFVVQTSDNEVAIVEHARWAEPLSTAIPNVIARELGWVLNTSRIAVYPRNGGAGALRISIDVLQFVSWPGDATAIEIAWTISVPGQNESILRKTRVSERVDNPGYAALARAHSRALARVTAEIADAIRQLKPAV